MPAAITETTALVDKLRTVEAQAKTAFEALNVAKAEAKKAGEAVLEDGNEQFANLDAAGREYDGLKQQAATIKDKVRRIGEIEGVIEPLASDDDRKEQMRDAVRRIGSASAVVNSEAFQNAIKLLAKSENTRLNGSIHLGDLMNATEFRNSLITGASSTSAGAFVESDLRGELLDLARRPTSILDLVSTTTTTSDTIEWIQKTARPTGAAFVTEATTQSGSGVAGGVKPEGTAAFLKVSAPVVTVAEWVAMTRQAVQDAPRVQAIIEDDLLYDLYLKIENSMLDGDGTDDFIGIKNAANIGEYALGDSDPSENVMDAIHRAITMMRLDEEEADAVLVRADVWETMRLAKDDNGNYLYGPPSTAGDMQVWGKKVIPTNAMGADEALVGSFKRGAEISFRTGVQTFLADQHADFFIRNLLAVLAEIRAAFLVKRPECFVAVDLS